MTGLAEVRRRIEAAAAATARDPGEVRLVAVSKTQPAAAIREAYAAGQRIFGESYAQELESKARELEDLPDLEWHFIGHLQSNKARVIVPRVAVVHSVDSVFLARELGKRARKLGRRLRVLVEVNVAAETQKHGVAPQAVAEVLEAIADQPALQACGLMTVPPAHGDPRPIFEALASLRNLHGGPGPLPELSMGMSSDLEPAIAAGATYVRVGTAIFGPRS